MTLQQYIEEYPNRYVDTLNIEFGLKFRNMGTTLSVHHPKIVETKENIWMFIDGENGLSIRIEDRQLEVLNYDPITYQLTVGTSDCVKRENKELI
jgi:hypothetical protein